MCCVRTLIALALTSAFVLAVACEEKKPAPAPSPSPSPHKAKADTSAADEDARPAAGIRLVAGDQEWKLQDDAGEVTGTVKFDGKPPKVKVLNMAADKYCEKCHEGKDVMKETVVLGKDNGLANCVVYVKGGLEKYKFAVPAKSAQIDQSGCMYNPHVLVMMAGQKLKIINSDATSHNIHPQPKVNGEWNVNQANKGDSTEKEFPVAEWPPIFVKCDVHDWMGAYVAVLPHPMAAVTDADGKFTLPKLNPGEYEIEVWHEWNKLKPQSKKVTVTAKGTVTADFTLKPE